MAHATCVFVRGEFTLEDLVECVSQMIGHQLVRVEDVEWPVYHALGVGLDTRVYRQTGFVDDQGILFSEYDYVVDSQDLQGVIEERYRSEWRKLFSLVLASVISRRLRCECIVVDKLQHLLETLTVPSQTSL